MCNGKDQKAIENSNGKYNIYGTGGIIGKTDYYLYDKESIGIGRKGTIDKPFYFDKPFWTVDTLFWSKIQNGYFPKFIYYLFQTIDWKKLNQSTGVPSLTSHVIEHQKIYVPDYNYQVKLSKMFDVVESKILAIESKINILKKYKIGVMQKSFESDKKVALGNILKEINVKTTQNNQYEILSSTSNGLFSQKEYFNHQVASENNVGYKIIKKGELILSPQNLWLGNINLNISFDIGIVSPSYKIYSIDNKVNKMWLIEELKTPKMLYNYKTVSEQGASVVRRNLDTSQFMDIIINIPSVQNSIGNILNALQNKINALSTSLNDMKKLKMHLLQSMFI